MKNETNFRSSEWSLNQQPSCTGGLFVDPVYSKCSLKTAPFTESEKYWFIFPLCMIQKWVINHAASVGNTYWQLYQCETASHMTWYQYLQSNS